MRILDKKIFNILIYIPLTDYTLKKLNNKLPLRQIPGNLPDFQFLMGKQIVVLHTDEPILFLIML